MDARLPYGSRPLPLPPGLDAEVIPAPAPAPVPDLSAALAAALAAPVGAPPLASVATAQTRALVIVSDASRDEPRLALFQGASPARCATWRMVRYGRVAAVSSVSHVMSRAASGTLRFSFTQETGTVLTSPLLASWRKQVSVRGSMTYHEYMSIWTMPNGRWWPTSTFAMSR